MKTSVYKDFLEFIKDPRGSLDAPKYKSWSLFALWAIAFFGAFILGIVVVGVLFFSDYNLNNNSVVQFINEGDIFFVLFFAAILAPILEELAFRLPLKASKFSIRVGFSFFVFYIFQFILGYVSVFDTLIETIGFFAFSGVQIILLLLFFTLIINEERTAKIKNYYKNNFRIVFLIFTILFASIHIGNYLELGNLLIFAPILVLPQFLLGYVLGYVRIKLGFIYAVVMHMLHNGLLALPSLLLSQLPIDLESVTPESLEALSGNDAIIYLISNVAFIVPIILLLFIALIEIGFAAKVYGKSNRLLLTVINIAFPGSGFIVSGKKTAGIIIFGVTFEITSLIVIVSSYPPFLAYELVVGSILLLGSLAIGSITLFSSGYLLFARD